MRHTRAVRRVAVGIVASLVLGIAAWGVRWVAVGSAVGAGFAAKVTCSLVHLSGFDARHVLEDYVVHELAPLGPALSVEVTRQGAVARVLGGLRTARAVNRPGLGCTLLSEGARLEALEAPAGLAASRPAHDIATPWPEGAAAPAMEPRAVAAALERAFDEPGGGGRRQTKAVLVARDGRLVAERYAPGVGPDTPLLSWSMAKSVTMALVGVLVRDGRLDPSAPAPVPEWQGADDPRRAITLDQLLRQSSGLAFDETYGAVNDVSRMLFTRRDLGAFAARFPLAAPPDTRWSYSSGTSNLVARIVRDAFRGDLAAMVRYANERLFDAAGMHSALFEPDASGSFVGSSFVFMTARDWARFGELFRRDGVWRGNRILPEGWVRYATTPTPPAPMRRYGAHWWLNAGNPGDPDDRAWPSIPSDVYAARGHSGQWVAVVPSARLVVVRLGLSVPDVEAVDGVETLIAELLRAFGAAAAVEPLESVRTRPRRSIMPSLHSTGEDVHGEAGARRLAADGAALLRGPG
jgi:CubicO group peptidase (beta-lactamase class C family)